MSRHISRHFWEVLSHVLFWMSFAPALACFFSGQFAEAGVISALLLVSTTMILIIKQEETE
jgi:hypothetical protein